MSHPSLQDRVRHADSAVHHGGLRASTDVTMRLWHATEGPQDADGIIEYLNTTEDKSASYHYLIDRDGTIVRMTRPNLIAYHAGDSAWPNPIPATRENPDRPNGGRSVNRVSIGIAFCNDGAETGEAITPAQIESALWLAAAIDEDYAIVRDLGHLEVSPGRKIDPGPSLSMNEWRAQLAAYFADGG